MPIASLYGSIASRRMERPGGTVGLPVICVGNYHVGGAGKTPVALALTNMLRARGERPFLLSRGYGGRLHGPLVVDTVRHTARDVGDELLLLARAAPAILARDRMAGALLARTAGASVIIMDDGFQNPALRKDLSLIVMDAQRGTGNGAVFPSGPLRAPLAAQIARTDAIIVVGNGKNAGPGQSDFSSVRGPGKPAIPMIAAHIVPDEASLAALRGKRLLAFAGIGDPQRFFATLTASGLDVIATRSFPDHHPFTVAETRHLAAEAERNDLAMVTTEKDRVRLATNPAMSSLMPKISSFAVKIVFDDASLLERKISELLEAARI
jgi:tetraacyldisaccharide 4'-kinase